MRDWYAFIQPLQTWIVEKVGNSSGRPPATPKHEDPFKTSQLALVPLAFAVLIVITASV